MKKINTILLITLLFLSCQKTPEDLRVFSEFKPILMKINELNNCYSTSSKPCSQISKTIIEENKMFLLDYGLGIHFAEANSLNNPNKKAFLFIPACVDMKLHDGFLYANNHNDLIKIDITDLSNPIIVERLKSMFDIKVMAPDNLLHPEIYNYDEKIYELISFEFLKTQKKYELQ